MGFIYLFLFFLVVQKLTCPVGDEEKATGTVFTVHSKRRHSDSGSGFGQASLGEGLQHGERSRVLLQNTRSEDATGSIQFA